MALPLLPLLLLGGAVLVASRGRSRSDENSGDLPDQWGERVVWVTTPAEAEQLMLWGQTITTWTRFVAISYDDRDSSVLPAVEHAVAVVSEQYPDIWVLVMPMTLEQQVSGTSHLADYCPGAYASVAGVAGDGTHGQEHPNLCWRGQNLTPLVLQTAEAVKGMNP